MIKDILLAILASYPVGWYIFKFGTNPKVFNHPAFKIPVGVVFMPIDLLIQYTWGTFLFEEWPAKGEHTFSGRIRKMRRRIVDDPASVSEELTLLTNYYKTKLNGRIPGHIDA